MGKRADPDALFLLPVRVRLVRRPDAHPQKEAVELLRALGRRFMPKPVRQQPEEAIPCPS